MPYKSSVDHLTARRYQALAVSPFFDQRRAEELAAQGQPIPDPFIGYIDIALGHSGTHPLSAAPFKGLKTRLLIVPNALAERQQAGALVRLVFELAHFRWESLGCEGDMEAVAIAYRYHRESTISKDELHTLRRAYPTAAGSAFTNLPASQRHAWLRSILTREFLHQQGQPVYAWIT